MATQTMDVYKNPGSFRDPDGAVYQIAGRVFRGVAGGKQDQVKEFLASELFRRREGSSIVSTTVVSIETVREAGLPLATVESYPLWLEHRRIDLITYPYEWCFSLLQRAALFHLELQMEALEAGYQLQDATAYNIQFQGCDPIFIDTLSFEPYTEGARWFGYRQYCEQFLAPLAVSAYCGIEHHSWYRGTLAGVDLVTASQVLPWHSYASLTLLGNIHAQAWAMSRVASSSRAQSRVWQNRPLPRRNYLNLLTSLRDFIAALKPSRKSYWEDYERQNSYVDTATSAKERYIADFVGNGRFGTIIDIGCNTGRFGEVALNAGAARVIGLDADPGALDLAVHRAQRLSGRLTPLLVDLTNPSPAVGWRLRERSSIYDRLPRADSVICLALIHHLVIARNIPLRDFVEWCVALAPDGVIEFVPRDDPMVAGLLANRKDIFPDYREEIFLENIEAIATVTNVYRLPESRRALVTYKRRRSDE